MSNKFLSLIIAIALFIGIFTLFTTAVNAKSWNNLCAKKQNLLVTLRDDVDIDKSKETISKIHQIKIIKITSRDKEWSKMVNKYDLPKMENPFKNEFVIKTKGNADIDEIYNKLKELSIVEKIEYITGKERNKN